MRSPGLRREGCSRCSSRNPVTLPMLHLRGGCHAWRRSGGMMNRFSGGGARYSQNALVLMREDLDEPWLGIGPVLENPCGARAAGEVAMTLKLAANYFNVFGVGQWLQIHAGLDAATRAEVALIVVNIGDAAAHAG